MINIYSASLGKSVQEVEREFDGLKYDVFKTAVGEVVADMLDRIQRKYREFSTGERYSHLKERLDTGAYLAHEQAKEKLNEVYDVIGLLRTF